MNFQDSTSAAEAQVRRRIKMLNDADNASDVEAVLSCYSETIEFYPLGKPVIKGKANIKLNYEKLFSESRMEISISLQEVTAGRTTAFVKGSVTGRRIDLKTNAITNINDGYVMILDKAGDSDWLVAKLSWWPR